MPYLNDTDYVVSISDINMQQIINSNESIRTQANTRSIAEVRSHLIQKYDIDKELAKTGEDRDQQLLAVAVDIALYHLHSRIAPRNIPELRVYNYMGNPEDRTIVMGDVKYPVYSALGWLQACAQGDITPALEKIIPLQGTRIRFGGNTKNINQY